MNPSTELKLIHIQKELEEIVNEIPTGKLRNAICDINILLKSAIIGKPVDLSSLGR